jgi:SAM-dependent methyltransferase
MVDVGVAQTEMPAGGTVSDARREGVRDATMSRVLEHLVGLAGLGLDGGVVLDAGCGRGAKTMMLAELGAARAIGVELNPDHVRHARAAAWERLPRVLAERVEFYEGPVEALPVSDGSVDLLLSIEGVGVYLDLASFLDECARVLRPGGFAVITDLNNALNHRLRKRTRELWDAYENGFSGGELYGHRINGSYVQAREAIIAARHPALDRELTRELALETSGLCIEEIHDVCDAFVASGVKPGRRYVQGTLPVDPVGMVVERMVDPRMLADELRGRGLTTRVVGYWGGARRPLLRRINEVLVAAGPLMLPLAREFRVVAQRPALRRAGGGSSFVGWVADGRNW